ncbi:epsin-2 isoform X2 [Protopterus annectens]|uniref:epsin-2 isoform X2 n=1 Tax=Protopterus annectens TaxID=7888 RepID=UPI001CFA4691|nr:epsin-2 isoform X2 [Protopterus annectens]
MTTSAIRRQMKNIVNNYSEAEIKVREATSNDPWGPSSSLMTEIADLTYNVVAFSEIMSMIWKRLNDHGKNWRHVYKALTLLDYLIKTGSERVAQQCKENIFAIQTLKDFQYIDRDGKDQGINVREKSKQLVTLLKDDDRLKTERAQALKTKERMAQVATGVGSNNQISFGRGSSQPNLSTSYSEHEYGKSGGSPASYHGSTSPRVSSELEQARPQTSGEEELQLQLALAMSREVAEQKAAVVDLIDSFPTETRAAQSAEPWGTTDAGSKSDPWGGEAANGAAASDPWQSFGTKPAASSDPWGASPSSVSQKIPKSTDPWTSKQSTSSAPKAGVDAWATVTASSSRQPVSTPGGSSFDPFSSLNGADKDDFSDFDSLRSTSKKTGDDLGESSILHSKHSGTSSPELFDSQPSTTGSAKQTPARKTPESFLGPNAALVNLDSLIAKPAPPSTLSNPFLSPGSSAPAPVNPFQVNQPQPLTLNQMRAGPIIGVGQQTFSTLPTMNMEPLPLSAVTPPLAMGTASVPAMGGVVPLSRVGTGVNMSVVGSLPQPLTNSGIPPSTVQQTNTTNPFLL